MMIEDKLKQKQNSDEMISDKNQSQGNDEPKPFTGIAYVEWQDDIRLGKKKASSYKSE